MSEVSTDISAFPLAGTEYHQGMTLRDYFAAKVMQVAIEKADAIWWKRNMDDVAFLAYHMAEAMLRERLK